MRLKFISIFIFLIVLFPNFPAFTQISHGGSPYFKSRANQMKFETFLMPINDMRNIKMKSFDEGKSRLKNAKFAYGFTVNKSIDNAGKWTLIPSGQRIWNLAITSPGAYSLSLVFDKFRLPKGGQLFVYNYTSDRVLGAYTEKNNKDSGCFAVQPLAGEDLIIEYIEPLNPEFEAELQLGKVYHDFKNVFRILKEKSSLTKSSSGSCNVNINCPEGLNWQVEKRAVCHITYGGYIASGTLINNTKKDGKPYILTSYHVIHDETIAEEAIFYFNYESETCEGTSGTMDQSISGSSVIATTNHLDFSLLEMSSIPPAIYQVYYVGWDRSGEVPSQTVCIHHPNGDVKKISMDYDAPVTGSYADSDYTFDENTHWHILDWELGTTEGGSSGSPLFDTNHRIVGNLTGGDANCSNSVNDYFAKFSSSWDTYPAKENQLKYWLDPENTGVLVLGGYNQSIQIDKSITCVDADVEVFFNIDMDYDTYSWNFGVDANPSTATTKGPHTVQYSSPGVKTISLTYTKDGESNNEYSSLIVVSDTKPNFSYLFKDKSFDFRDASENAESYLWNFGDGESSELMNPSHVYKKSGKYQVSLTTSNVCGDENLIQTVNTSYDSELEIYPNPSKNVKTRVDLNAVLFNRIDWWLYDTRGAQRLNGFVSQYNSFIDLDLRPFPSGLYILKMDIDGSIVTRKITILK
ncbi:PKD domain-containing protein [Ancylomarina sp. 16SWW S1-10-2]|uniref:PKD domain-containing protein n=1 Tax=Ancylomarina sp. 16SWW S1-10-2 TaxID=2499681 RepID=UPI0012AD833E|nr:PKD domain-containing protein [Ancylomarina sp. 16SWW S1-10-2]MRT92545.1 PKD domain-containing protein [Ancylomarina sp. 16SWW S1-10-2]